MNKAIKGRGGPGRGQGRKPLDKKPSVVIQARVTEEQRDEYKRRGAAKWLREQLDKESKK